MILLDDWTTPFGLAPFDQIEDADFEPALTQAIQDGLAGIEQIANNPDPATFENTILAQDVVMKGVEQVASVFYTLAGADTNEARDTLQRSFAPQLSKLSSEISSNKVLFARVKDLWDRRANLGLDAQEERVLYLTYRGLVRSGAELTGNAADLMAAIKSRLATLGTEFTQNMLADERDWFMPLTEADLDGLPDFVIDTARAAGFDKGQDGPIVTLSRSLIVPFLQFCPNRDLREKAYKAWTARGANDGPTNNLSHVTETLALRQERAKLLGYDTFADFKLETEMAKTPQNVRDLLMRVWELAKAAADRDAAVLSQMMQDDGVNADLKPWDWRYYSEQRRKAGHDLDEAELKPYLQLNRMIDASFDCASRLFGLSFEEVDVPLYHTDARAWEVTRGGKHIALFIGDYFARGSKRSGAWCSAMRAQRKRPSVESPIVINVCNFAKPAAGNPALLSFDDARTLFHEFGHALHQMLSDVDFDAISGTSVARDFVELPSQLYEHWLEVPEVLEKFAIHADSGAPMPRDLLTRMLGAATYDMGFATVEYLGSAIVDLEFHNGPPPADPMARQAEILESIGMPVAIEMRHATPHFAHVFAGDGYSSAYYSYMWSEVMDADAFEAFTEAGGPFDLDMAQSLSDNILSKGGSEEADVLYTKFRGTLPGPEALLRNRGLVA